ncbi:cytosine permease [Nocardiopsis sp. Huas11]|uniref:cytosine permease n=1 Tax=Nocardiopsis sp. Huas11 TaxID=2183912 RepID=UPI001F22ECD8|nr:cytosine permease [Nocardiopsis sp. Huas11]
MDHIPDADRHGGPRDLFWVWFGANLTFIFVINGALVVGLGLGFWAAVTIFAVGAAHQSDSRSWWGSRQGMPCLWTCRSVPRGSIT